MTERHAPSIRAHRAPLLAALLALALLALGASPARSQAGRAAGPLDARLRAEIVDSLSAQLLRHYVEADTAKLIADAVRARLRAGAYDTIASPLHFCEVVTGDMRRVNGDLHLSLRLAPEGGAPAFAGVGIVRAAPAPGGAPPEGGPASGPAIVRAAPGPDAAPLGNGPRIVRRMAGPGEGVDSTALARAPWARDFRQKNYGLTRVEILPGNVGYLEVSGFMEAPGMQDVMVSALRFLERTDAVIIDVRRNHGGSGNMSHLLFSHFLPAQPIPTIRVKSREEGMSRVQESFAEVPGPRRPDVPLYVLTGRETGSAAEEFSFVLKNLGRATLVGDRTAGAGHMVGTFDLPAGFVAGVSLTRVSDPRTGSEWEGIGVQPDLRVEPAHALAAAHVAALHALAAKGDPSTRHRDELLAEWVEARDRGLPLDAARAAALVGTYEGDRTVRLEGGRLIYGRGPTLSDELVPLGGNRFSLGGEARFTFAPGSPSPQVQVERGDGSTSTYARIEPRRD